MLNNTNRIIYAICKCILYKDTHITIEFKDKNEESFKIASRACNNMISKEILKIDNNSIYFKNNSCLSFGYIDSNSEHPDDCYIDEELLNKVLKPSKEDKEK